MQHIKYKINEMFDSIQGEGANIGKKATFIRFSGCNLKCEWCDTKHEKYIEMSIDEIMQKVMNDSIIITGGEPTIYNLKPLLKEIKRLKKWVALESNGTMKIEKIKKYIDYISISPKSKINKKKVDEIRLVNDNLDIETILKYDKYKCKNFYITPLEKSGKINIYETIKLIAEINKRSKNIWRLNQQVHKILKIK